MKDYEEIFESYQNKSIEMLEKLNVEDYSSVINLLEERETLINKVNELSLSKEILLEQVQKLDIQQMEIKIKALLSLKMKQVKSNIEKLELIGKANTSYNKSFYDRNKIFSKKV